MPHLPSNIGVTIIFELYLQNGETRKKKQRKSLHELFFPCNGSIVHSYRNIFYVEEILIKTV